MARYDEDPGDSRQHCVHGTFIGSWWGPDYLCGWCEDGVSVHEMECILAAEVASVLAQTLLRVRPSWSSTDTNVEGMRRSLSLW